MAHVIWKNQALILLSLALVLTTGCEFIQPSGTTEETVGTPVNQPADFTVVTPPVPPTTPGDQTAQTVDIPDASDLEEGFVINEGALKTKDSQLVLRMITHGRLQMKITPNIDCSGGTWEPFAETKVIATPAANTMNMISVQYADWDSSTRCFHQSILHDNLGPQILFTKYPLTNLSEGSTADLSATVTDAGIVKTVTCSLNQLAKPCAGGVNQISITQLPVGDYIFAIHAEDDLGNTSDQSVRWTVVSTTRTLSQGVHVNDYKKVDILIVIDNSGSMEYEQQSMGKRTGHFLSVINGLDYQIAVTTTDPRDIALGDGRFIPISGSNGQYILDSTTSIDVAQQRLSATLQRPETGSGTEEAIYATYRAVERYNANDKNARSFFRDGAQFAVLVISDEDESANTSKNDPQNLMKLIRDSFGGQKSFSFNSIITKPGDLQCKNTYGATYADRYSAFSTLTGGVIGSVCALDYAPQLQTIAQGMRDLLKTLSLQCEPLASKPLTILKNGVTVNLSYHVDGVNLKFDTELDPGDYTINYSCLKN